MQGPLGYPSVATFTKVIIEGSAGGLFAYDTAPPVTGSLVISIAAEQGTDQWNNFYLPGITVWSGSYPNNPYVNIQNGTIFFGGGQAQGGFISTSGGGSLQIRSPLADAGDTQAIALFLDSLVSHISPTPTVELLDTGLTFSNGTNYIDITQNSNNQLQIDQAIFGESEIITFTTFISLFGGSASNTTFSVENLSNPDPFFYIDGLGDLWWGDGSSAVDTELYRYGPGILATNAMQADTGAVTGGFHEVTSGFLSGVGGQIQYKYLVEAYLVFLRFRLTLTSCTLTNSSSVIYQLPAGYYFSGDNTVILMSLVTGSNVNTPSALYINNNGNITWEGVTGTYNGYLYGQAIYSTQS